MRPSWGTFLGAAYVDRFGGVERVRAATGAHVLALWSVSAGDLDRGAARRGSRRSRRVEDRRCRRGCTSATSRSWQPRWGEVIRGPAWGTFLGAAHVDRLGGVERVRAATGAHVLALSSGGAYVQATSIEAPLVEDRDPLPAQLIEALAPVMGQR